MRLCVGIVSDTHGCLDERVLQALSGSDLVVHAGDVGDVQVLARLRAVSMHVVAVKGNNDVPGKLGAASRAPVAALPDSARVAKLLPSLSSKPGTQASG